MRALKFIFFAMCIAALTLGTVPVLADEARDLGLETLAPIDGWASEGAGTTGGAAAAPNQIYTVHNRAELIAALNNGVFSSTSPSNPSNEPKIIYVSGVIDGNVDDNNQPLACEDYYRNGYTLEAFLATYDPAVWGYDDEPFGPLEDARLVSRNVQQGRVRIRVGSNTTIVGLGDSAVIRGVWFDLRGSSSADRTNIIIRNITFRDTFDCFPAWDPTDGVLGSWNALYDSVSLRNTSHVWIDHNTFEDVETSDDLAPHYFGVLYQQHDGALDITNASDLVTVSWNRFQNHDKLMLIGSSDSASADVGKLRVTLHHNLFKNIGQRAPRARFGQVHVYNNYYIIGNAGNYVYSWGVGKDSAIYAQNNYFETDLSPDKLITVLNGTAIYATGTYVGGHSNHNLVDVVAAYNAANDPDLSSDVGWAPVLYNKIYPTQSLPGLVPAQAGPFKW